MTSEKDKITPVKNMRNLQSSKTIKAFRSVRTSKYRLDSSTDTGVLEKVRRRKVGESRHRTWSIMSKADDRSKRMNIDL